MSDQLAPDPAHVVDPAALAAYSLPYLDMLVVYDNGDRVDTHADQRDMRRAQIAIGCDPSADPIGFTRAASWSYLHRTGQISTGWKDFDTNVSFVIPLEVQTAADPTQKDTG